MKTIPTSIFVSLLSCSLVSADDDLAKAAQNPIAGVYSLPIEMTFDYGAANGEATFINIQPVIPITVGDWNLVNRTIIPLIDSPGNLTGSSGITGEPVQGNGTFGLGDINHTTFFSPVETGKLIWGVGPSIGIPSASDDQLGSGKWTAGPSAVVLTQSGSWSLGVLGQHLWSFAGDSDRSSVNRSLMQPFVTYNLGNGWGLTTDPIITYSWAAKNSSDAWVVPLGGGFRKMVSFWGQPASLNLRGYYNVVKPDAGPDWNMIFTVQFLFPKS